jgi:hypothetical protein
MKGSGSISEVCGAEERLLSEPLRVEGRATQGQGALEAQNKRHPWVYQAAGLRGLDVWAEINKWSSTFRSTNNPELHFRALLTEQETKLELG